MVILAWLGLIPIILFTIAIVVVTIDADDFDICFFFIFGSCILGIIMWVSVMIPYLLNYYGGR